MAHCRACPKSDVAQIHPGLPTVVPTIQALLEQGKTTRGFTTKVRGGHLILGRADEDGPDPRFRPTPLGGGRYGLSLYDRKGWDPLPYEGTLNEMVDVMNNDLGAWATPWPDPPL